MPRDFHNNHRGLSFFFFLIVLQWFADAPRKTDMRILIPCMGGFYTSSGVPHICDCVPTASRLFPTVSWLFQFAASIDRNFCNPDWNLGFWCYFRLQYLFPPSNLVVCSHCFCLLPQAVFTAWFPLVLLVYVQRCWHGFFCLQCCLLCLPDSRSPAFKHGFLYVRLVLIVGPADVTLRSKVFLAWFFSTSLIVVHYVISHTIIF